MDEFLQDCSVCEISRPWSNFSLREYKDRAYLGTQCRGCRTDAVREYRAENKDRINAAKRADRKANPEKYKDIDLRKTHGMTLVEYRELLEIQGGVCVICRYEPENGEYLPVDHCHETGTRRALLCIKCNTGLGAFRDDPELLRMAAYYIEAHWVRL
jgi:Recombination endonuclease VII